MGELVEKIYDGMKDVVLKIEDINEIIVDATPDGSSNPYEVVYERLDNASFIQTVLGEGVCECCGEDEKSCKCLKEKAIVDENVLANYINDIFNTQENIPITVNGTKYRKR